MRKSILFLSLVVFLSCGGSKTPNNLTVENISDAGIETYANTISEAKLKTYLYAYASDEFEGRDTGAPGQKKAVAYLKEQYKALGIPSAYGTNDYFQKIPEAYFKGAAKGDSENVLAYIEGTEKPHEVLIISAHLDHVGQHDGKIYNGADDDGSGTVALLEIAAAFMKAKREGLGPKRSLLFLHVTGEEKGLFGSQYYAENPLFPLTNTIANINIDMIGRVDPDHKNNPNYVYVIGADRLSTELDQEIRKAKEMFGEFTFDYKYNDRNDPERIYYRSDHYNFAKKGVPSVFFFSGIHEDYHQPTDTADKIDYPLLTKRTKIIFYSAWNLVNREARIKVDRDGK
jgi:Zn-dependent M28 family amino/carboxypeptidase